MERFPDLFQVINNRVKQLEIELRRDHFGDLKYESLPDAFKIVHLLFVMHDLSGIGYLSEINNAIARFNVDDMKDLLEVYRSISIRIQGFKDFPIASITPKSELHALAVLLTGSYEEKVLFNALDSIKDFLTYDVRLTIFYILDVFLRKGAIGLCADLFKLLKGSTDNPIPELDKSIDYLTVRDKLLLKSPDELAKDIPKFLNSGEIKDDDELLDSLVEFYRTRETSDHDVLHNVGIISASLGKLDLARDFLSKALSLREEIFGVEAAETELTRAALRAISEEYPSEETVDEKDFLSALLRTLEFGDNQGAIRMVRARLTQL